MSTRSSWYLGAGTLAVGMWLGCLAIAQTPDFPLRCRGASGVASSNGNNLVIDFSPSGGPAGQGLQPGQCSWLDRALRPGEPTRVVDARFSASEAQKEAQDMNGGGVRTFWVFNAGEFLHATASAPGTPTHKPVRFDNNN